MLRRLATSTLLLVLLPLLALPAGAQITITSDLFETFAGGDVRLDQYFSTTTGAAGVLALQDGANQTWDFTPLTFEQSASSTLRYRTLPDDDVPGSNDPSFAAADFAFLTVTDTTSSVSFYDFDGSVLAQVGGLSDDGSDDEVKLLFDPPSTLLVFPFTYGDTWSDTATQTTETGATGTIQGTYTVDAEVDGWGTLVTPEGTFEALRVRMDTEYTYLGTSFGIELYTWYVEDGFVAANVSCSIFMGTNAGCAAGYTVAEGGTGGGGGGGGNTEVPSTAPADLAPADGATDVALPPTLTWAAVAAATGYELEVATDGAFSDVVVSLASEGTSAEVEGLEAGVTYYWRVRATNEAGAGPFSGTFTFTTASGTNTSAEHTVPGVFALEANYPNPFNPQTTFAFELYAPAHARLVVIDALGREVATVVDAVLPPGRHTIPWTAADLPSGAYLYRLEAGRHERTRTLVLLK